MSGPDEVILLRNLSSSVSERPLCKVSSGRIAGTPTEAHGSMAAKFASPNPIALITPVDMGKIAVNSGALELPLMTAVLKRAGC